MLADLAVRVGASGQQGHEAAQVADGGRAEGMCCVSFLSLLYKHPPNKTCFSTALGNSCAVYLNAPVRYLRPSPPASLLLSSLGIPTRLVLQIRNRD